MLFVYSLLPFLIYISTLYISTNVHFSFTFSFLISAVSLLWGTSSLLQASHLQRGRLEKASCLFSSLGETLCQHCGRWPMTSSDRESSSSKTGGSCHTNLCVWTPHMCLESLGQGWVWLLYCTWAGIQMGFTHENFWRLENVVCFFPPWFCLFGAIHFLSLGFLYSVTVRKFQYESALKFQRSSTVACSGLSLIVAYMLLWESGMTISLCCLVWGILLVLLLLLVITLDRERQKSSGVRISVQTVCSLYLSSLYSLHRAAPFLRLSFHLILSSGRTL